jgi:type II secretion system protein G
MMTRRIRRWCLLLVSAGTVVAPALAAEVAVETAPATTGPAATTTRGAPVMTGRALSDLLPGGTLLYMGWPGIDALSKSAKDTELAKLMNEPEVQRFRTLWWKDVWPAIEEQIIAEMGNESNQTVYELGKQLAAAMWRYPTAIGVVDLPMAAAGPRLDLAVIIRAGKQAQSLSDSFEKALSAGKVLSKTPTEFTQGEIKLKRIEEGLGPLMWGVVGKDFVIINGTRAVDYLASGTLDQSLTQSKRFAAAMKTTGGSAACPVFFLDLKGVAATLQSFQPMFAGLKVPVLGGPDGVQSLLKQLGLDTIESLSSAMVPEGGGFKTSGFLHLPGASTSTNPLISRKPLASDDLAVVPRNVQWATVANWDIAATYKSLLGLVDSLSPEAREQINPIIEMIEKRLGVNIETELLSSFENSFAIFDTPDNGGIWLTGMVLVAKVKPDNALGKFARNLMEVLAEEIGDDAKVVRGTEDYRGQKIEYVSISGIPMPIAPAWAEYQGRWVAALYPQMVRAELDHLMNRAPSLLDNTDFQRGRTHLPAGAFSISYVDTRAGLRQVYSIALPVIQIGAAMLQKEGIPLDVGMLPSWPVISRHTFGSVSASAVNEQGVLTVSYGSLPVAVPAIGAGGMAIPLMASVTLPSLARARHLSKRTVSAANLKGIGMGLYTYASEHDDKFPDSLQVLVDNGGMSPKALISPLEQADVTSSYIYIPGQGTEADQRNVIAYENPENYDNEGTTVLFADSHVEYVNMEQFKKLLQDTYRRLGREVPETPEAVQAKERNESPDAKVRAARAMVGRGGSLPAAIELFKNAVGRYPTELKQLVDRPEEEQAAEKWTGPYIKGSAALKDPWGHPLMYLAPAKHNKDGYDLWSVGPDGQDGTEDDVTNWKK